MNSDSPLISSLLLALQAAPDDVPLRLHLAELMLGLGRNAEAIAHLAQALQREPESADARAMMTRAIAAEPVAATGKSTEAQSGPSGGRSPESAPDRPDAAPPPPGTAPPAGPRAVSNGAAPGGPRSPQSSGFDWGAAESEVGDIVPPRFVDDAAEDPAADGYSAERPQVRLSDVGGMEVVKQRLHAAFLAPLRNPELRRLYGKSLRGGLLLYGPPGCGKTFLARAIAGELDAHFLAVGIADVLDMYIGRSEQNLHEIFLIARRKAPCVLFFDEVDALGQRRSQTRNTAIRTTVNQLLLELDDVQAANEGVYVLGATNQPWDVDTALRRPGRFDRTVLILPPDLPARKDILAYHLRGRPVAGIDLEALGRHTDAFSGADLAHLCESAAERALLDSASSGNVRMIGMADFEAALSDVRPSTQPWLEAARSVAMFANEGGTYDELLAYLKQRKML